MQNTERERRRQMATPFHIVFDERGNSTLTIFFKSGRVMTVADDHPNFDRVFELLKSDSTDQQEIERLTDPAIQLAIEFKRLTSRVAVRNAEVYFDNDRVDNSITKHIVKALQDNTRDWKPLVRFLENVDSNPSDNSKEQLYDWLNVHDFEITDEGCIVAYKGVRHKTNYHIGDKLYESTTAGPDVFVNGKEQESGYISQDIGDWVEMPRSKVVDDPNNSCSVGLHVGTKEYAAQFGNVNLQVIVNPRDVVSVPHEGGFAKVRVCRYVIKSQVV
jgi:hypothetical protein